MPNYELVTRIFKESFYEIFPNDYTVIRILSVNCFSNNTFIVRTLEKVLITAKPFYHQYLYSLDIKTRKIDYLPDIN